MSGRPAPESYTPPSPTNWARKPMPAPTSQPLLLLLEAVIDAPVARLVIVKSSLPTQPPPALP
jgi:hypothetical protein